MTTPPRTCADCGQPIRDNARQERCFDCSRTRRQGQEALHNAGMKYLRREVGMLRAEVEALRVEVSLKITEKDKS